MWLPFGARSRSSCRFLLVVGFSLLQPKVEPSIFGLESGVCNLSSVVSSFSILYPGSHQTTTTTTNSMAVNHKHLSAHLTSICRPKGLPEESSRECELEDWNKNESRRENGNGNGNGNENESELEARLEDKLERERERNREKERVLPLSLLLSLLACLAACNSPFETRKLGTAAAASNKGNHSRTRQQKPSSSFRTNKRRRLSELEIKLQIHCLTGATEIWAIFEPQLKWLRRRELGRNQDLVPAQAPAPAPAPAPASSSILFFSSHLFSSSIGRFFSTATFKAFITNDHCVSCEKFFFSPFSRALSFLSSPTKQVSPFKAHQFRSPTTPAPNWAQPTRLQSLGKLVQSPSQQIYCYVISIGLLHSESSC